MGKKYRNLFDKIVDIENLRDAYNKTVKGGNRYSKGHLVFKENLESNLYKLQTQMISENYEIGEYYSFKVYEPKVRTIHSLPFKDRIVQHAINNIIEPIFDKTFYSISYACRKGKGTHKGINKVQSTMRKIKTKSNKFYFLKMDFKKYFASVHSSLLKAKIAKKITDAKTLRLFFKFIGEKGIMIGNLLSQLCANIFGHIFDNFIKTKLKIKYYFRYMDDTVIFHESKQFLQLTQKRLHAFMRVYLKLKFSKWFIQKADVRFLDFLGMRIKSAFKLVRKDSVVRAKQKVKFYARTKQDKALKIFLASWHGHIQSADSFNLKNQIKMEISYARAN